ncbi:helix-turn-helix domain-containing protein [Chitinivorax sp. B]|uniref:helix-turn-helix domain-containing protein n=1 Tax=Chitinivorax sp. B TaxID=2502235 RepID=UPI0010F979FD|nr:helix-turn-helix domain-containing protein [Chitinivorax sp. B]
MAPTELLQLPADEKDAELAKVAQRCIMAALDHSHANKIVLISDDENAADAPVLELPPQALRFFADMLGMMAQQRPISLVPQKHELSTQEAAHLLNVSRPFVIKQIEQGRLQCRKVGRHRRIEFAELMRFKQQMQQDSEHALQELASLSQEMGLGY